MITAAELFVMANISCDDEILTERLSNLCDALEWGFLSVHNVGDCITGLDLTDLGRSYLLPLLPTATA